MVCQINKTQKLSEWVSKQQESVKRTKRALRTETFGIICQKDKKMSCPKNITFGIGCFLDKKN
jgi:hypothetical protein